MCSVLCVIISDNHKLIKVILLTFNLAVVGCVCVCVSLGHHVHFCLLVNLQCIHFYLRSVWYMYSLRDVHVIWVLLLFRDEPLFEINGSHYSCSTSSAPSPPIDYIWAGCKREDYQNCSVLYCVLKLCSHRWAVLTVLWIGFYNTGPISLCLDLFIRVYLCVFCVFLFGAA